MMQKAETSSTTSSDRKVVSRVCATKQFPGKLHDLLSHTECHGLEWIIGWCHNGKAFTVRSQDHLLQILPIFFGQTKFRSFQRQLNMWHFERVLIGPFKGAFMHPCFVRGNKDLCASMSRHHLPSPEMYSRAWMSGASSTAQTQHPKNINQMILDNKPDQLIIDRHQDIQPLSPMKDPKARLRTESSRGHDESKVLMDDAKQKVPQQETRDTRAPIQRRLSQMVPNRTLTLFARTESTESSNDEKNVDRQMSATDQEEDWSLLSDCLQHVINPETCISSGPSSSHTGDDLMRFYLDALAPGTEKPASPEAIEDLFAEFSA